MKKKEGYVKARSLESLHTIWNKKKVDFIPTEKNKERMNLMNREKLKDEEYYDNKI